MALLSSFFFFLSSKVWDATTSKIVDSAMNYLIAHSRVFCVVVLPWLKQPFLLFLAFLTIYAAYKLNDFFDWYYGKPRRLTTEQKKQISDFVVKNSAKQIQLLFYKDSWDTEPEELKDMVVGYLNKIVCAKAYECAFSDMKIKGIKYEVDDQYAKIIIGRRGRV